MGYQATDLLGVFLHVASNCRAFTIKDLQVDTNLSSTNNSLVIGRPLLTAWSGAKGLQMHVHTYLLLNSGTAFSNKGPLPHLMPIWP
ncbi:hypothetical protein CDAR_264341 [Caerostris darwini]|uniref:Uncharacterized protein n=1 Tax=Caerostris darwini TaxID=1538125 RepID=A0AAV4RIC8_9ARAC|nr:hypothetical protein CDAR_264341 [Caerostris darwini]